jgi:glycerol transport system ATP-binding protein
MARIDLDLAHAYGPNPQRDEDYALLPLKMSFENGGAYALLGPSGCGKTTLLNIVSGLVAPSQGTVSYDGRDVTRLSPQQRNIAQVFQFPVIYDTMTVAQNLAFPLRNRGVPEDRIKQRVAQVAEMLDMSGQLDQRAAGLAADAKQKISLGRGLVREDVSAVLFDEPLTVIDPHLKWQLRRKLKQIHHELKLTLIYVTHDQVEALTFAQQVVVMTRGRAVQVGTASELFERPRHTFVGNFIGSPGMNFLPARGLGADIEVAQHRLPTPAPRTGGAGRFTLGVRPEYVRLAAPGAAGALAGVVTQSLDVAWFLILPVFVIVAFSAIIPLMTVVNYSVQDILGPGQRMFVGAEWFREMLTNSRLHDALIKQLIFSGLVLLIEIPLGIAIALTMPHKGWTASVCLVLLALPLLIPWNVIGTIWHHLHPPRHRPAGLHDQRPGHDFDHTGNPLHAWITVMLMDVWHWTRWWSCWPTRACAPSRRLLPGGQDRRRQSLGGVPLHPAAQDARRADHRRAAAVHGQLHDLHRALRRHRRRSRQRHDLPVHLSGQEARARPFDLGRPRPSRSSTS